MQLVLSRPRELCGSLFRTTVLNHSPFCQKLSFTQTQSCYFPLSSNHEWLPMAHRVESTLHKTPSHLDRQLSVQTPLLLCLIYQHSGYTYMPDLFRLLMSLSLNFPLAKTPMNHLQPHPKVTSSQKPSLIHPSFGLYFFVF